MPVRFRMGGAVLFTPGLTKAPPDRTTLSPGAAPCRGHLTCTNSPPSEAISLFTLPKPGYPEQMFMRAVLILLLAAACGRPLTEAERGFASQIQGDSLDLDRIRLVHGAPVASVTFRRLPRPRLSCRERILPPVKAEIVTASPAAIALFNHIFFAKDWYLPDFMPAYPDQIFLVDSMLLAHELTHAWQWQNRAVTGYHPLRAAAEHGTRSDPYLFDLAAEADFLSYGYEQQGSIIEEYVCCRALAPKAPRTRRLHQMIRGAMPVSDLPQSREADVYLPWKDVRLSGICD